MSDVKSDLRDAFEAHGHDVASVSENRDRIRVELIEAGANAAELRTIPFDTVEEDAVVGVDVSTETSDGQDVRMVVSFRLRA
ncbi:MAG: hypothetical protein ACI8UR_000226 [Natronomonas sp.]|jgi:hypothetical protein|uniref:hypothetical protein n=1 Tax=Natronomonas sp. TaxID=2184060 RepID=UPI0039891827